MIGIAHNSVTRREQDFYNQNQHITIFQVAQKKICIAQVGLQFLITWMLCRMGQILILGLWYQYNKNVDKYESLTQNLGEADDGGSIPDHWEIMRFAVQQQLWSKSHFGPITAWFYRQCSVFCHTSLFCDGVITTWVPGTFKAGKEGRREPTAQEP